MNITKRLQLKPIIVFLVVLSSSIALIGTAFASDDEDEEDEEDEDNESQLTDFSSGLTEPVPETLGVQSGQIMTNQSTGLSMYENKEFSFAFDFPNDWQKHL